MELWWEALILSNRNKKTFNKLSDLRHAINYGNLSEMDSFILFNDEISSDSLNSILPYKRDYKNLSELELLRLIEKAKTEKWKVLDLTGCGLTSIPKEISTLSELIILDLSNQFEYEKCTDKKLELPDEIGNLMNLRFLCISFVGHCDLPLSISKLKNLQTLNLSGTKTSTSQEWIYSLCNLELLGLIKSNIVLSHNILNLKKLRRLYYGGNGSEALPSELGALDSLTHLYLRGSEVRKLPHSFVNLKNLEVLKIDGTPLSKKIPPEVINQTPQEIIRYALNLYDSTDNKLLYESKMIIVGQGGVGKTCLLNRLVFNAYHESPPTEGIDIKEWRFSKNNKDYNLSIWDFGGQEIYHATHQFFLTRRSLYVFVWDSRQEEEYGRIDFWLNTIQTFSDDSPIVIVINKCDTNRKSIKKIDIDSLKIRFPQIIGGFYVSCQDGINIKKLRSSLKNYAVKLPLMETIWFSKWVSIRHELEKLSNSSATISYTQYLEICSTHRVNKDDALSLIKYLHDLGVVLYFNDDNLLKNIVILKPEWGTNAVYKILDSEQTILKNRNGILYYSDLPLIWSNHSEYPADMYPYMLQLMKKFQLSFELKSHETYLVAELLENKRTQINLTFEHTNTIFFKYSYTFLPAGIMTRFIVLVHRYLMDIDQKKLCWLKGAYLTHRDAHAIVELSDSIVDKAIYISVTGENRRDKIALFHIILEKMYIIHNDIPKLKVKGNVRCKCQKNCDFYHDYNFLLRLDEKGRLNTTCEVSIEDVSIQYLLDGLKQKPKGDEVFMNNNYNQFNPVISPNISPEINVFVNADSASKSISEAQNTNNISTQILNEFNNHVVNLKGLYRVLRKDSSEVSEFVENVSDVLYDLKDISENATHNDNDVAESEYTQSAVSRLKKLCKKFVGEDSVIRKTLDTLVSSKKVYDALKWAHSYISIVLVSHSQDIKEIGDMLKQVIFT
jgi:small GTP-binding protein